VKRISEEDLLHIFNQGAHNWEALRGKSVFITGATGFFGKWLLDSFLFINKKLSLNARVCALSRNPDGFLNEFPFYKDELSITFIKGDIISCEFPKGPFQFIIHAATDADAKLNSDNPLLMLDTTTVGTRRVLDFAKTQPLEAFLLTSSGAVYGKQPAEVTHVKEEQCFKIDINDPASAYAEGKRVAELYCSVYYKQFQVPVKIARCFAFVGPYLPLDKHFAIGNFILNAIDQNNIVIKGDGTPYRSYLYAADLTIWLWTILIQGKNNTPYNVGSSEDYSLKTVAEKVAESTPGIDVEIFGVPDATRPVERYVPDINFTKNQLGLKVLFNLNRSIERTKEFYAGL
jgi:dTDP-glucose 4,6-dehydratase